MNFPSLMKLSYGIAMEPWMCLVEFSLISSNRSELETSATGTSICLNSWLFSCAAELFPISPSEETHRLNDPQIRAARTRSDAIVNKRKDLDLLAFNDGHLIPNVRSI
ncbi:MAG: hypothetical protein LUO83_04865 [Methanothrix sp.]|nr:hypothetical protein [Methanothrix sp.]